MNTSGVRPSEARYDPGRKAHDVAGSLLVELMIGMAIFAVGVLGLLSTNQSLFRANQDLSSQDLVSTALLNAVETLSTADFLTVYASYSNRYLDPPPGQTVDPNSATVGRLLGIDGNPARVFVTFDVDETHLPADYGPIADLDGDGTLSSVDVSGTYRLLPARLELNYLTGNIVETRRLFIVLGK